VNVVVVESNELGRAHARAAVAGVPGLVLIVETDSIPDLMPVAPASAEEDRLLLVGLGHIGDPAALLPRLKACGYTVVGMWPESSGDIVDDAVRAGILGVLRQPLSAGALAQLLHVDATIPALDGARVLREPVGPGTPRQCD
jgi:hypothetical protein